MATDEKIPFPTGESRLYSQSMYFQFDPGTAVIRFRKVVSMKFWGCVLLWALAGAAYASDHGPVFGYATPVNSEGELSCDTGVYGRYGSLGSQQSTGTGCKYGLTPHVTVMGSFPENFGSGSLPESSVMPGVEWSAGVSWRFLHSVRSVGKRVETTASAGVVYPGPQADSGVLAQVHRAPGITTSIASGMASRSQYIWVGVGYTRFSDVKEDRRPDTISSSAVYGYRPPRLRRGYDQWDYRGFAELTAEHTGGVRLNGPVLAGSSTTSVWLGPSVLAIFKNIAIEGGVQAPVLRASSESIYGRETIRFAINVSYLRYSSHTTNH